jgi:hypothetical protein
MAQWRFSQLSAPRQALLRQCQQIGFGEILRFLVRDREPVLTPDTEIIFDVKLDRDEGPRPEHDLADFDLRRQVVQLFARMDSIGSGVVERLEVHSGLPHRIRFKTPLTK